MSRKPNPHARPYELSPEAKAQRKQAAIDRWEARKDREERLANLAHAHASPNIGRPRKAIKIRHAKRDTTTGRFVRAAV